MKKHFSFLLLVMFLAFSSKAQNTTFEQNDKVLNLGVGLAGAYYSGIYSNKIPPVSASLEFCIKDELFNESSSLGVGAYLGYTSAKWAGSGYGWSYSNVIAGAMAALHYQFIDKLDTYTGLLIGYNFSSTTSVGGNSYSSINVFAHESYLLKGAEIAVRPLSSIIYSWRVGGRYYFTDNLAGLLELGYGISYLNIGVALKF